MVYKLYRLTSGARLHLFMKALISLLILATYAAQALVVSRIVSDVYAGNNDAATYIALGIFILILITARTTLTWAREVYGKIAVAKVKEGIRVNLFNRLFILGPGGIEDERTGRILSIFTDGVESMEAFLIDYIPQALVTVIGLTVLVTIMLQIDMVVGLVVLVAVLIALTTPMYWDKLMTRLGRGHWNAYGNMSAQFIDAMQGMTTLKTFGASEQKYNELESDSMKLQSATMANLKISLLSSAIMGFATIAGTALAVGIGAWRMMHGLMPAESLFVILFLSRECFRPTSDLNGFFHQAFLGITVSKRLFEFMESEPAVKDDGFFTQEHDGLPEIVFDNVTFSYKQGERPALRGLSMKVGSGQTAAIVGKSGAGKSTIINLMLRFYTPFEGKIYLNNQEISEFPMTGLRSKIAVVFQDTYLFFGTALENLLIGKPEATRTEAEEAAKLAGIHDLISNLPNGYDTIIGERGVRLSGGERQRIAIARAILKDAPILLLDEATSNVDAESEAIIQRGLETISKNRTTIIIAHRLSTVQNADVILVLENERLAECGTASELMLHNGVYAHLMAAQQTDEREGLL